jgi:hypothetical protein
VLILDMIEVLSPLGKYKYDTWRILLIKCYIDNSVRLWSYIRNVNRGVKRNSECMIPIDIPSYVLGQRDMSFTGIMHVEVGLLNDIGDIGSRQSEVLKTTDKAAVDRRIGDGVTNIGGDLCLRVERSGGGMAAEHA